MAEPECEPEGSGSRAHTFNQYPVGLWTRVVIIEKEVSGFESMETARTGS